MPVTRPTMIGGYVAPTSDRQPSPWISVSVEAPFDPPGVGRNARIADLQGAELCLFKNAIGDPADAPATPRPLLPERIAYQRPDQGIPVLREGPGFSHRAMDMGPGGTYHILSKGGVDRGGVTGHLPRGVTPHWLPYVFVDDVDATIARARKLGATIQVGPEDIPGIDRFGALGDPTGAVLAVMKQ